ncbi:hypothetical protein FACS1894145_8340 [Bacteroidia bacterium]|nr:hypothetical protein FACS1894145_8340 [Bacteroidia bacterium]
MSIDFYKSLEISGIGLAGVFIFMTIFYFVSTLIDKMFPPEEEE